MTGKQSAVLWIGLILIGLNLAMKWGDIKNVIFSSPSSGSSSGGPNIPFPTVPPFFLSQPTPPNSQSTVQVA